MKAQNYFLVLICLIICVTSIYAQAPKRDQGKMIEYGNKFWDEIEASCNEFKSKKEPADKSFKMDLTGYDLPTRIEEFKTQWHNPPISQGSAGTCWCYSTVSFLESEVYRIHNKKMKFSEMYTVYWEYVEKARRFVRERGDSHFDEGSQANAVFRMWKKYGCLPAEAYTDLKPGQKFHYHDDAVKEMKTYLKSVKQTNAWNEEIVLATIKSIMNHHFGTPPTHVQVNGRNLTPLQYLQEVVKIDPDDYVDIMSLMESPYYQKAEYKVPDNWWHSKIYHNVPLDVYMAVLKEVVTNGYTVFIGGDVSESGYLSHADVALVPTYDIPSAYIDENARQLRFVNGSTTDDHGIHLLGYQKRGDQYWFLIKDSGSGSRNGKHKGYYFYHEDYIKLKMMNYAVHRSAVKSLLEKFK